MISHKVSWPIFLWQKEKRGREEEVLLRFCLIQSYIRLHRAPFYVTVSSFSPLTLLLLMELSLYTFTVLSQVKSRQSFGEEKPFFYFVISEVNFLDFSRICCIIFTNLLTWGKKLMSIDVDMEEGNTGGNVKTPLAIPKEVRTTTA